MWQWHALVAMICFAMMQLMFRHLSRRGVDSAAMLLMVFAFGTLPYLVHVRLTRTPIPASGLVIALVAATALLSYVGNLFSVRALSEAPNPGYAVALVSLQAAVVTVAAVALQGASLSWVKAVGVALCCVGLALLVI